MIEFFRDVLSGPLYIFTAILSIILIMAIIGFIMERKKLEKEEIERIAIVDTTNNINSINNVNNINNDANISNDIFVSNNSEISNNVEISPQFVSTMESAQNNNISDDDIPILDDTISFSNPNEVNNVPSGVKRPIIVFEDPDQKN